MGTVEYQPCRDQSRTERNAGIDGTRSDPTASRQSFVRHNHRSGALIGLEGIGDDLNADSNPLRLFIQLVQRSVDFS